MLLLAFQSLPLVWPGTPLASDLPRCQLLALPLLLKCLGRLTAPFPCRCTSHLSCWLLLTLRLLCPLRLLVLPSQRRLLIPVYLWSWLQLLRLLSWLLQLYLMLLLLLLLAGGRTRLLLLLLELLLGGGRTRLLLLLREGRCCCCYGSRSSFS